ncbi:hypothetical protein QFC21_005081 [Naganishia friedmannii]|uniref:Uncharacterized protein n=1 Tax=Naganishia friedmannii TaxID=89922 RepID=A0ACC2VD10_9TREE|nr:hypothetical protein QFC21_005081 [Naganishia friedmannii]
MPLSPTDMEERRAREQYMNRPLPNELRHPDLTLADLQEQAISRKGLGEAEDELGGVTLRSLFWRVYLGTLDVSQVLSSTPRALLSNSLREQRRQYDTLREKWLVSPDGRWAPDCTSPEDAENALTGSAVLEGGKRTEAAGASVTWDPLNLGETNPWQTWFAQTELRAIIDRDVERTFPDIPYYTDPYVRKVLRTILFLWAVENPDIQYRQGMHELLAVIMLVCDRDSLDRSTLSAEKSQSSSMIKDSYLNVPISPLLSQFEDGRHSPSGEKMQDAMQMVLDRRFLEHDVYGLFVKLMEHARSWYEWRTETVEGSLAQDQNKRNQATQGRIIKMCQHMQGVTLKQVDPVLAKTLDDVAIEPQIWGIRWIRLLFTREFPFYSALRLWDGLFAMQDRMDDLVESVCVAMLLRIRQLIRTSHVPLDVPLIFAQAIKIMKDPTAMTGAAIVLENQEVLGIQPLKQDAPETPVSSSASTLRSKAWSQAYAKGKMPASPSSSKSYGFESFTRGLMDRAQASGIDKALLNTVSSLSEFRRNLPEIPATTTATNFPFKSFTPERTTTPSGATQFPTMESLSSHLSPPHIPARTVQDADRDIADLRLVMVGMGKTMANWLDTVEEACTNEASEERLRQALLGLRRLQETLIDPNATTTELAKDWPWSRELATTPSVNSSASIDFPLEADGLPLEALAADLTITSGVNQEKADSPQPEEVALPADTIAMETSSTMTPRNTTSTYLHSPSSFSRKPRFQYTSHPISSERIGGDMMTHQPAITVHQSTDYPSEKLRTESHAKPQHSTSNPTVSIADAEGSSPQKGSCADVDVDPLSGQVTVNSEYGSSGHGPRRGKDPLRGLGIL